MKAILFFLITIPLLAHSMSISLYHTNDYQRPIQPSGPIMHAIQSGSYENIYTLMQNFTQSINGDNEKVKKFSTMLKQEQLSTKNFVKSFFQQKKFILLLKKRWAILLPQKRMPKNS